MKNWKTTTLGILTIIAALIQAAQQALTSGHFDLAAISPQLLTGWALIHAADAMSGGRPEAPGLRTNGPAASSLQPPALAVALLFTCTLLWGCAAIQSTAGKVTSWAASPGGQAVLGDVGLAVDAAAAIDPEAGPALGAAGLAIRSLETAKAPSSSDLATAIGSITGNATVAAKVAPAAAAVIAAAGAKGVSAAAATEAAAVAADQAVQALVARNP